MPVSAPGVPTSGPSNPRWNGPTSRTGTVARTYAATVLADSPAAFWRLNETSGTIADDVVGANDGTYNGGITLGVAGRTTDGDKAASFDGVVGTRVIIPVSLGDFSAGAVSCDAWIKSNNPGLSQIIFSGYNAGTPFAGWGFGLSVTVANSLAYWSGTTAAWVTSTATITDNGWHHVAATVSAAGAVTFYIDGQAAGTAASNKPNAHTNPKAIGAQSTAGASPFPGTLDEVAVYAAELTNWQVFNHFNAR